MSAYILVSLLAFLFWLTGLLLAELLRLSRRNLMMLESSLFVFTIAVLLSRSDPIEIGIFAVSYVVIGAVLISHPRINRFIRMLPI
ncbi:hypothetical protein NF212_20570 [Parasalinivibrio latis]|uniref:hypothetical protein n=1 Tax=Parasalinivibrio latis TaxID=2952610 RepID=UPI0030E0B42B